jgi:hypothetical protein
MRRNAMGIILVVKEGRRVPDAVRKEILTGTTQMLATAVSEDTEIESISVGTEYDFDDCFREVQQTYEGEDGKTVVYYVSDQKDDPQPYKLLKKDENDCIMAFCLGDFGGYEGVSGFVTDCLQEEIDTHWKNSGEDLAKTYETLSSARVRKYFTNLLRPKGTVVLSVAGNNIPIAYSFGADDQTFTFGWCSQKLQYVEEPPKKEEPTKKLGLQDRFQKKNESNKASVPHVGDQMYTIPTTGIYVDRAKKRQFIMTHFEYNKAELLPEGWDKEGFKLPMSKLRPKSSLRQLKDPDSPGSKALAEAVTSETLRMISPDRQKFYTELFKKDLMDPATIPDVERLHTPFSQQCGPTKLYEILQAPLSTYETIGNKGSVKHLAMLADELRCMLYAVNPTVFNDPEKASKEQDKKLKKM